MLTQSLRPTRRSMLGSLACGCIMLGGLRSALAADEAHTDLTSEQALETLRRGNVDFVSDRQAQRPANRERRAEIAKGQKPFAVIVGCSDSRVPPELVFSRGLGELFTVRVAGNSVDRTALGTIEYGVAELGCPLVVVLGHERCGAVLAAVKVVTEDASFPGAIGEMVAPIVPAVLRAQRMQGDLVANSVKENVRSVVRRLRQGDDLLTGPVQNGKLNVVGGYYSLADGAVEFL
jgi:carbonic anhydrase